MTTAPLSRSVEDYLKTVYHLSEGGEAVTTSDIAQRLEVAPASVTGMIKKLAESGHLEHLRYRGVRLTNEGRQAALAVVRRHRILEAYLITKLAYDWSSVHAEAERLEHAVSDELIERMAFALGQPRFDPHGAPIPTPEGHIEPVAWVALADVGAGRQVVVREVDDDDPERLRYLKTIGLVPAAVVTVAARQPFDGPLTIRLGGADTRDLHVGAELARSVRVEERP